MLFKWATNICKNFGYMALVDDDIQLDVQKILNEIRRIEAQNEHVVHRRLVYGHLEFVQCLHMIQNRATVMRRGKWAISKSVYPGWLYPRVCTGAGFLMSNRAVARLYAMSKITLQFSIDDVYISGILRVRAGLSILRPGVFNTGEGTISVNHVIQP